MKKTKAVYPSKKTLNLCVRENRTQYLGRNALLILAVLLLATLFSQYLVISRLQEADTIKSQVDDLTVQKTILQASLANFNEVKEEYHHFANGWMKEEEKSLLRRGSVLELLETMLLPNCTVSSASIRQNTLSVQLAGVTMDETSHLVEALYARDDVQNVSVYTASSKGGENEQVVLSMVITMKQGGGSGS